ncbi:MAG: hypothetical protein H7X92_03750 [Chitinophagales bacterium]|nr:hypothetical protein [Hyphomicrobiales bacterium]
MKILAVLTPSQGKTPKDFEPFLIKEEQALWPMYRQGLVREMYFQPDPLTISLVFEATSKTEVESQLQQLPMVDAELFQIQLITLGPWLPIEALFQA